MGCGSSTCPPVLVPDTSNKCNVNVNTLNPNTMDNLCVGGACINADVFGNCNVYQLSTEGGNYASQYCEKMSSTGEWIFNGDLVPTDSCLINTCAPYTDYNGPPDGCKNPETDGCCRPGGGIKIQCYRQAFNGSNTDINGDGRSNAVQCCLNDYNCALIGKDQETLNNLCFSDSGQNNTCPNGINSKDYRNTASRDCQDVLFSYCTGQDITDPNDIDWIYQRWDPENAINTSGNCYDAVLRNIYRQPIPQESGSTGYNFQRNDIIGTAYCFTPDKSALNTTTCGRGNMYSGTGLYNSEEVVCDNTGCRNVDINTIINYNVRSNGYVWAQNVIEQVLTRYSQAGYVLGSAPGTSGYDPLQDFFYKDICCPFPGLCSTALNKNCASFNPESISYNPAASSWCGCYLQPEFYQTYAQNFGITPQCSPLCNLFNNIPIVGPNAEPQFCEQNICLIDNIKINIVNSSFAGGLNIDNLCSNCQGGQCSCLVNNDQFEFINDISLSNVNPIINSCGTLNCTKKNNDPFGPPFITGPCFDNNKNPYDPYTSQIVQAQDQALNRSRFISLIIVVGILIIIFFLIYFFFRKK